MVRREVCRYKLFLVSKSKTGKMITHLHRLAVNIVIPSYSPSVIPPISREGGYGGEGCDWEHIQG